jgi:hypothetical protein
MRKFLILRSIKMSREAGLVKDIVSPLAGGVIASGLSNAANAHLATHSALAAKAVAVKTGTAMAAKAGATVVGKAACCKLAAVGAAPLFPVLAPVLFGAAIGYGIMKLFDALND